MQSARLRSPWVEPLRNLPLVLASLLTAVVAVELLVKLRPAFVEALRDDVLGWTGGMGAAGPWATLLSASVSLVAVALTATALASFANGVKAAPYFALAPLLVAFSAFAIGAVPIELPIAMDTRGLAVASALIWLGGGVLLLGRSAWNLSAGLVVTCAPAIWLAIAYARSRVHAFDGSAQQLMLILVLGSFAAPLIAFAQRRLRAGGDADSELGDQLLRLVERAEQSEARAALAERQLATGGQRGAARDVLSDTARLPRAASRWHTERVVALAALAALVVGVPPATYFAGYLPMRARLDATLAKNVQAKQEVETLSLLRERSERERTELVAQLTVANARATQAELAAAAAATAAGPLPRSASHRSKPTANAPRRQAQQATRDEAAPAPPVEAPPDPAEDLPRLNERSDDPLEGLD
jgi:hypothetical protein